MSQIGPDYTYNTDTTVPIATRRKLVILARKDPEQAAVVARLLGYGDNVPGVNITGDREQALQKFDKYTRNQIQTLFAQELAISKRNQSLSDGIRRLTESGVNEINEFGESISDGLDSVSREINELMKPVSTQIGQTLGTLTGMMKDPLGAVTLLPQALVSVVRTVNPEYAAKMEATFKGEKMKNLANLPTQIMGSLQNLITEVDKILAVPLAIISDLYYGYMALMEAIADLVDEILGAVQKFIFGPGGLLDSILPIQDIFLFLDALNELAGEVQGITTIFLGANQIAGFALSIQNYTRQLEGFLTSPQNLLAAYLPPVVQDGLYILNNPQQLINNILPPELSQYTAKLTQITGFGFNGNMGFGLESVLEGLRGGVLQSILTGFINQYPLLTPLLDNPNPNAQNQPQPPTVQGSEVNPAQVVTKQGTPQPQTPPKEVVVSNKTADRLANQTPAGTAAAAALGINIPT